MMNMRPSGKTRQVSPRQLRIGDVASIEWRDVTSMDRITMDEVQEIEEPGITRCWGMVVRKTRKYLFVASEVGDHESDSLWVEVLPYKLIERCKILEKAEH
jgi:hypothetical protein